MQRSGQAVQPGGFANKSRGIPVAFDNIVTADLIAGKVQVEPAQLTQAARFGRWRC
jgi:hypothetical protein